MENSAPRIRTAAVSAVVSMLCIGLALFGTGCPTPPPTPGCTSDADCAGDLVCNTATGQCEEPAPVGCTSDADCEEGQFFDTGTGECVANENLYEVTKVDADYDSRVHFEPSGHADCTVCHHAANEEAGMPNAAAQACVPCHSDDPDVANSYKAVAHDLNESGDGCRMCHAAEWSDNCAFCHPLLEGL